MESILLKPVGSVKLCWIQKLHSSLQTYNRLTVDRALAGLHVVSRNVLSLNLAG